MSTLLIADDSPVKTLLLKSLLKQSGWQIPIVNASTTDQAMAAIDDHGDVAFAFVDYYIPSQNGPAVIAYLKQQRPHCRIALVSSSDSAENWEEAKRSGAEAAICTSWESDRVEEALTGLIARWREGARRS
jgi:DNA-binding NarL/FixJ family response regulator